MKKYRKKTYKKKVKKNKRRNINTKKAGLPNYPYKRTRNYSGSLNPGYVVGTYGAHETHIVDPQYLTGTYSHATVVGRDGIRYHYGFQRRGNQFIGPNLWSNPPTNTIPEDVLSTLLQIWEHMPK